MEASMSYSRDSIHFHPSDYTSGFSGSPGRTSSGLSPPRTSRSTDCLHSLTCCVDQMHFKPPLLAPSPINLFTERSSSVSIRSRRSVMATSYRWVWLPTLSSQSKRCSTSSALRWQRVSCSRDFRDRRQELFTAAMRSSLHTARLRRWNSESRMREAVS